MYKSVLKYNFVKCEHASQLFFICSKGFHLFPLILYIEGEEETLYGPSFSRKMNSISKTLSKGKVC